jgi:transglutaminase-like putative cysteine protease
MDSPDFTSISQLHCLFFMTIALRHSTTYTYADEVWLNPQTIRLEPRSDAAQQLLSYKLSVFPTPAGESQGIDIDGSPATLLWFDCPTARFELITEAFVETRNQNPYNFLLTASTELPKPFESAYSSALQAVLQPYIVRQSHTHEGGEFVELVELAEYFAAESRSDVVRFLSIATEWLHANITPEVRLEGVPLLADETLRRKRGSCRDVAVVLMELCRARGLAARFVSGYCMNAVSFDEQHQHVRHLHAWVEVYLEGAGWRGFDPSYGCMVGEYYITCAAAASPILAAPVSGSFSSVVLLHENTPSRLIYDITLEPASYLASRLLSSRTSSSATQAAMLMRS